MWLPSLTRCGFYFSARGLTIILQKNGTIVVLVQAIITDTVPVFRNEISVPAYGWQKFVNAHDFCLRGNVCVDIMFCEANDW